MTLPPHPVEPGPPEPDRPASLEPAAPEPRFTRGEWKALEVSEQERYSRIILWWRDQIRRGFASALALSDPGNSMADGLLGYLAMAILFGPPPDLLASPAQPGERE